MKGLPLLLFYLLYINGFGQDSNLEMAASFLYTDKDSAYYYLSLAEQEEIVKENPTQLLEVYTYYNAVSIQNRDLPMLQKTLEKQTALFTTLGPGIEALSEGLYYKIYYWFDSGRYNYILNDYETASPFFYRILNEIENNPEPSVVEEYAYFLTASNSYLATMFRNQMKYEVAEEFYQENLRLHQKYKHEPEDIYDTQNLIASLKSAQENFTTSNKLARESIRYYLKKDPYYYDTSFLSTSALLINNYLKMQQADSAHIYLKQALPFVIDRPRFTTDFLYLQAKLAVLEKKYSTAFTAYNEALNILQTQNRNGDEQSVILKEIGDLYTLQNDSEKATNRYEEAMQLFSTASKGPSKEHKVKAQNLINVFPVLNVYNQLLLKTKSETSYNKALKNGLTSLDYLSQLRKTDYNDADKLALVANLLPILESSIEACYELAQITGSSEYTDTAFMFFEQSKSPVLMDAIIRNNASRFSGIPDSLLQQERMLKTKIASLEKDIQLGENDENSSLFIQKRTYEKFISQLETSYPSYYNLKYETKTVLLKQFQERIPKGTVVLSYFYGTDAIYILVIKEANSEFTKIPYEAQDLQSLATYQRLLGDPGSDLAQLNKTSFKLYKKLIAPFIQDGPLNSLLIIPDGLLRTVPFEAMNTSENSPRYLIEKMACRYANSATLWYQLQSEPVKRQQLVAFAPSFITPDDDGSYVFSQLPNNVQEVETIADFFPGDIFFNEDATLANFKNTSKDHSIIHLATHALANDDTPEYSFLAFAPDKTTTNLLYVNDIYTLELQADMVTLSACETGVGSLQKGEGAISLARAFFYSGAKSLVYTLWNINDTSSSYIMSSFYQNLREGISKDVALQDAKLAFLKKNKETALVHPYYWSGFIIQGNTLPLVRKSNTFLYLLGLTLIIPVLLYYRKKLLKLLN